MAVEGVEVEEVYGVFSRIPLDYVPWMLQPFLKGYVATQSPKSGDFRVFCEWFRDNPDKAMDEDFKGYLLNFYYWFMNNLRNPRNDLVLHLDRYSSKGKVCTFDSFLSDGKVVRLKYHPKVNSDEEKFDLTSPIESFKKIYDFLIGLEGYFLKIL